MSHDNKSRVVRWNVSIPAVQIAAFLLYGKIIEKHDDLSVIVGAIDASNRGSLLSHIDTWPELKLFADSQTQFNLKTRLESICGMYLENVGGLVGLQAMIMHYENSNTIHAMQALEAVIGPNQDSQAAFQLAIDPDHTVDVEDETTVEGEEAIPIF